MQTVLNNTAHDLAKERQDKMQALHEAAQALQVADAATVALTAVVTERDALKLEATSLRSENDELKKPIPTKPASAEVVVSGEDHL